MESFDRNDRTGTASASCSQEPLPQRSVAPELSRNRLHFRSTGVVAVVAFLVLLITAPPLEFYLESADHGFQLGVGNQVLFGWTPGIDNFQSYGPLVPYTSALGIRLSGSLIGETLLCAFGYSVALALVFSIVSQAANRIAGASAAVAAFLLLARFFKWYIWCIPLLAIFFAYQYVYASEDRSRHRWLSGCGLVLGIGWLYRFDVATGSLAAVAVIIAVTGYRQGEWSMRWYAGQVVRLAICFAVPLTLWMAYVAWYFGPTAPFDYLRNTVLAAQGVVTGMAQPLEGHAIPATYLFVIGTYLLALAIGLRRQTSGDAGPARLMLLVPAVIGLSCIHQALHRRGLHHLLQVAPPTIIAAHLLAVRFVATAAAAHHWKKRLFWSGVAALYILAAAQAAWIGMRVGACDMTGAAMPLNQKFAELHDPLNAGWDRPAIQAIRRVRREVPSDRPILVFPVGPQLYFFTERRFSGRRNAYYPQVACHATGGRENLAEIRRDMPSAVILTWDVWGELQCVEPDEIPADFPHRDVARLIREKFRRVAYENEGLVVLLP